MKKEIYITAILAIEKELDYYNNILKSETDSEHIEYYTSQVNRLNDAIKYFRNN